jgi:uncharacterized protein
MEEIFKTIRNEWDNKNGAVIFSTLSKEGIPNSIYATCVSMYGENKVLIANNYFDKTIKNILSDSKGTVLFMTKDDKAFQVKGSINYHTSGEEFDDMKKWNPKNHPGHGVAVLNIEEIYSGAKKLF